MYLGPIETRKLGKATVGVPRPPRPTLFGHIYQTIFDYEGHQFWVGADYYPEAELKGTYLVSYKVGIVDSWFATAFEYTVPLDDIYIKCHEDEILNIVRGHIEEKRAYAAKRYLESIYTAMWWWDRPTHKGLFYPSFYCETTEKYEKYVPYEGIRESVLLRLPNSQYFYGHISPDETEVQVLGTNTDSVFVKLKTLPISSPKTEACEKVVYDYVEGRYVEHNSLIQTANMHLLTAKESYAPDWEADLAPYREKDIRLWPEWG